MVLSDLKAKLNASLLLGWTSEENSPKERRGNAQ
jgi:hypothetical protein